MTTTMMRAWGHVSRRCSTFLNPRAARRQRGSLPSTPLFMLRRSQKAAVQTRTRSSRVVWRVLLSLYDFCAVALVCGRQAPRLLVVQHPPCPPRLQCRLFCLRCSCYSSHEPQITRATFLGNWRNGIIRVTNQINFTLNYYHPRLPSTASPILKTVSGGFCHMFRSYMGLCSSMWVTMRI